jgi:hypothetical protein
MARTCRPSLFCCVLVATILFAVHGAAADGSEEGDRVLLAYKGKPYSCEDLTLVRYQEGLKHVKASEEVYDPKIHRPYAGGGTLEPEVEYWEADDRGDFVGYYHHFLNGAIEKFICARVFELFKERHPVDASKYYSQDGLSKAVRRLPALEHKNRTVWGEAFAKRKTFEEFAAAMEEAFPKAKRMLESKDFREFYATCMKRRPYELIARRCLPIVKDGKTARWFEDYYSTSAFRYHLQAEIEREKLKYIEKLDLKFGDRKYFVIRKAYETDLERVRKLIDSVSDKKGTVAIGGLEKINETLQQLGSVTRLELWKGAGSLTAKRWGISLEKQVACKFIPLDKPKNGLGSYLYIFQSKPTPGFKKYDSGPGDFLYDLGEEILVKPLVEEVLKSTKLSKGFSVRSAEKVMNAATGYAIIPKTFLGEKLPEIEVK